ncbi:MAG: ATP-binding protein [Alphaproteobacteria bacterium]|nr:ATP-binding protein [Alphaproteobacteria bacterium]
MEPHLPLLERIATALERLAPPPPRAPDWSLADAFAWDGYSSVLVPVPQVESVDLELLHGIDRQKETLLANTARFAEGRPANHALLWGARGMGKSALVKAVLAQFPSVLAVIEVRREELDTLPALLTLLADCPRRVVLYCDDLSFDAGETEYKALKSLLEGGIRGGVEQALFYATSNRRHLLPRAMSENEERAAVHASEGAEEHLSLSDRFGLWLGFYGCDQDTYLAIVRDYAEHFGVDIPERQLEKQALEWAVTRGQRSGRVAWQFIKGVR